MELRHTGFEELLGSAGIDHSDGLIVVARSFTHITGRKDGIADLDPFARRFSTGHEVGVAAEIGSRRVYTGMLIGDALHGDSQVIRSDAVDYVQVAVVEAAISRLLIARSSGELPFLTKSLLKIDIRGD